jgi:hypothetical protein
MLVVLANKSWMMPLAAKFLRGLSVSTSLYSQHDAEKVFHATSQNRGC